MQRPANYSTKHSKVILAYLASVNGMFVSVAQIEEYLQKQQVTISRPTVYRQLEKLICDEKVRKHIFDGSNIAYFIYINPDDREHDLYHMKCEVCDRIYFLKCDEVSHVSRHISETHDFQVNDSKTVFYGKCKLCLHA